MEDYGFLGSILGPLFRVPYLPSLQTLSPRFEDHPEKRCISIRAMGATRVSQMEETCKALTTPKPGLKDQGLRPKIHCRNNF